MILARLVALALLAAVAADLADNTCDPMAGPRVAAASAFSAADTTGHDPCAAGCVPDCMCCSATLASSMFVLLDETGPSVASPLWQPPGIPVGVRLPPYHPPSLA